MGFFVKNSPPHSGELPSVSLIIAAYNEEKYIGRKIENALSQKYPHEKLQIIVISDGSSDRTLEIAESFDDERLTVLEVTDRMGKANALNQGLKRVAGDVIVFTDANVFFESDAVEKLASCFSDELCGAVSGRVELVAMESGEPLGEGAYMKYERFIQKSESKVHTMVGIDGGMFAIRRRFVNGVPINIILDDFYLAMRVLANRSRIIYEPKAVAEELVPASVAQEFRRKTRIAAGGFQILRHIEFLKRPFSNITATIFFISHKFLRWLSPFFMITLFVSNAFLLAEGKFFTLFFFFQVAFYFLAVIGALLPSLRERTVVYIPYYFSAVNAAFFIGFWKNLLGTQKVTWSRVDR
ncbi:MAG: glycosyltransferase family 2 protein [Gammaproteobacteria bacterium]|nr:glycosyltransferase family 2 protein [Gammaproteobacteria bacterium]